jgi:hypothetical protein
MWARLRRFSALPAAAQGDFVRAALLLPLIRLSLWLRGFRATQKSLQARGSKVAARLPEPLATGEAQRVCQMVLAAGRHSLLGSTCLERALALWWLLARRGITSQLRIGARKSDGKFEAHAWVERDGEAIGEPEGTHLHYRAFEREFSGDLS